MQRTILFAVVILGLLSLTLHAQVPQLINYQGRVAVGTTNFNGSGAFKFALVNAAGTTTYWSNDGTSAAGSQPTAAVTLTVTKGLYSVLLGDTSLGAGMTAVPAGVFANADVRLRVWFNDGTNGSQLLTPDQRLAPNGYLPDGSVSAAALAGSAVTSTKIANGAVGSTQIAASAVQSANIAAGAVANTQLANSALTITAGTGLAGGGTVSLGGNVTLTNAGVRSIAGGGGISVSAGTGAITLGSNATSFDDIGTIVLRDELGGFSAGTINLFGALSLPSTSNANSGVIVQNGIPLLHTFGSDNFFAGLDAGNFTMSGIQNTAVGTQALRVDTTGLHNSAMGALALGSNTTGSFNVAIGRGALFFNTTGGINTATGLQALYSNTTGSVNTASGVNALFSNTTASRNVALGNNALTTQSFDNGGAAWNSDNVAVGVDALLFNQPTSTGNGTDNTAVGTQAMRFNTTGYHNTASGFQALYSNTTGNGNTATGYQALFSNTGNSNTATGWNALFNTTSGPGNSAFGERALNNNNLGGNNTAVGVSALQANTSGNFNTAIGRDADVSSGNLTNATAIGYFAVVNASNKVRIGNNLVTVIEGQVGLTVSSDRTKKENFEPVDGAEVLRKIRGFPLTSWNYIGHDPRQFRHYGPMAQDFYEAFGHDAIGSFGNDTTINSGDLSGILMIAVQALDKENLTMRDENAAMERRLAELESRDQEREARLAKLEQFIP